MAGSGIEKFAAELIENARKLSTKGKGFLAADESTGTIGKRLANINVENNEDNRRAYRELLFTTPGDWGKYISGIILFEETLYQKAKDGTPFVDIINKAGVIPGIKVDKGTVVLPGTNAETTTQGHDDLGKRCAEYYKQGARFAKWRAVLKIGPTEPSELSVIENARGLARYAAICQENGLVPIVEPEVLMDGTHDIVRSAQVTERVLAATYKALNDHHVLLEGSLLKPNMVLCGMDNPEKVKCTPQDVATFTVRTLMRTVPHVVPGIFFLSGGQSEEEATVNLNAIAQYAQKVGAPYHISFSYGRALQKSTLQAWKGKPENVKAAQETYFKRAEANSQAQLGQYTGGAASAAATASLYEKNYVY